uniref:Uncharacterized protein n=1 Tax=Trachelomonas grandis TaxID=215769 RepID=A0A385UK42_9EUGL|nr:hypothetical protein [Trachelomonas grandis]
MNLSIPTFDLSLNYYYIRRETLNKNINNSLRIAGQILNKKLTSDSYRRGVAILVARLNGIYAAKKRLNQTSISNTEVYIQDRFTKKELKTIFNDYLSIKNSADVNKYFDKENIEESIESHLKKEEL